MSSITPDWFAQYMHQVAANVKDRTGAVRFTYKQLRTALDAIESGEDGRVPQPVLKLFANIIGVLPDIVMDDRTEKILFLALLNCHMAYSLASEYLLNDDPAINNEE